MAKTPRHRDAIVQAAARLFRTQGFAATGLNQIVEASGAPKGSVYHYFPAGKEAIGAEAVAWAGHRVEETLTELAQTANTPGELLRRYAERLAGWMADSGFADGCPVATTLLETTPRSSTVRQAGIGALESWAAVLCGSLLQAGVPEPRARRLAHTAIACLEGALIQSRVLMQREPILDAADELARVFDAAASSPARAPGTGSSSKPRPVRRASSSG